jgi:tRNA (mo5U34)-methyltransferase
MIARAVDRVRAAVARRLRRARAAVPADAQARLGEPAAAPSAEALRREVAALDGWYQRIYLGRGVYTLDWPHAAYHETVWAALSPVLPADLDGVSVLDVGCNAGYFALQAKRRGAGRVLGLEPDPRYLAQAELCRRVWGADVEYRPIAAEDLSRLDERFDLVLLTGILYHLRHPFAALEQVARLCSDAVAVETEVLPERRGSRIYVRLGPWNRLRVVPCQSGFMKFLEGDELNSDSSNWWVPDTACVLGMLRAVGFRHFSAACYPESTRLLVVATKHDRTRLDRSALERSTRKRR